jgi:hypothetical protein
VAKEPQKTTYNTLLSWFLPGLYATYLRFLMRVISPEPVLIAAIDFWRT